MKKFYAVIGNPPYQEETEGTSDNPIYHLFMDEAYKVGENVELITPARFLFNAGKTPNAWNRKMLNDPHLKVLFYDSDPKFFQNVELKGGVAITNHNMNRNYGAIGLFVQDMEMNSILHKVNALCEKHLDVIGCSQNSFKFTELLYKDHPELEGSQSKGHRLDLKSNVFEKMSPIFFEEKPDSLIPYDRVLGRLGNRRVYRYVKRGYICNNSMSSNLDGFKIALPKASGVGKFGESLSEIVVVPPRVGMTETFISFGNFPNPVEAENLAKYIKTKFARAMLGVLKITQDNTVAKYAQVPLQDFSDDSDIDWSQSISGIGKQLYQKYDLALDEIEFIESHVKEMD